MSKETFLESFDELLKRLNVQAEEKDDMIRIELTPCVTIYMSDEMIHVYVEDENGRTCLHGNAVSVFIGQYSFGINIYFDEMYVGKYWRGFE